MMMTITNLTRFRAARNRKRTQANDISIGEGWFLARAAQVPWMKANRIFSRPAMIRDFNQMASRPYAEFVRFRVGARPPASVPTNYLLVQMN
jgi:hypothetical protein